MKNKQIKALFAKAVGAEGTMLPDFSPETTVTISIADLGMFAELIIKECVDIAFQHDRPKLFGPGIIIGNRIEEHFGVES